LIARVESSDNQDNHRVPSMIRKQYVIDGARFGTLAEASAEFTRALAFTTPWQGNLDAFNDFLHGGFGTPDEGFILIWQHSTLSRDRLGYGETVRWFEAQRRTCHPSNRARAEQDLLAARGQQGPTLFDMLVEIIQGHEDIELRLE
jgi:barstar (barnase inhibitor)